MSHPLVPGLFSINTTWTYIFPENSKVKFYFYLNKNFPISGILNIQDMINNIGPNIVLKTKENAEIEG